ncbi:MAG: hypothetical protein L0206_18895 [Actinobacteria bacterium]|nr:hypothetical protein [Actinomycetota bacterium]
MKVTILLSDAAQAMGGKLYILGGGWSICGPEPVTMALALKIEVPWNQANLKHTFEFRLVDGDGQAVELPTQVGSQEVVIGGDFEVGRPPGLVPGSPLDYVLAINFQSLPLPPGGRFEWRLSIDGTHEADWTVGFTTRQSAAPTTEGQSAPESPPTPDS